MTVSDTCVGLNRTSSSDLVTHSAPTAGRLLTSPSTPRVHASPAGTSVVQGLRLRLKPGDQRFGSVQGAWWPRSSQLTTELPPLLAALSSRLGCFDRVVYDENAWAPAPSRLIFRGILLALDSSPDRSINTISLIREHAENVVLLVVPPHTSPTRAYTAVMTAAKPDDVSTTDELLGIGKRAAEDRRFALIAHERWESDGGASRRRRHQPGGSPATSKAQQVPNAQ